MKTTSNRFFIVTAIMALTIFIIPLCAVVGQSKKDLQKQRDEINDKIEQTKKMIRDSERQQKSTIRQVQLLNEQLTEVLGLALRALGCADPPVVGEGSDCRQPRS